MLKIEDLNLEVNENFDSLRELLVKKRYINCFLGLAELEKELTEELLAFLRVILDVFRRFRNEGLTEELQIRRYKVEKDVRL
jgi:hypothetical protein